MATDDQLSSKVPKYHQLIYPTPKALKALGGSGTNEEILDKVCELAPRPSLLGLIWVSAKGQGLGVRRQVIFCRPQWRRVGAVILDVSNPHRFACRFACWYPSRYPSDSLGASDIHNYHSEADFSQDLPHWG